jgi:hypothetical protein
MDKLFDAYIKKILAFADIEFHKVILPWILKYHLEFLTGNGDYWFYYTDKTPSRFIKKYHLYDFAGCSHALDNDKIPVSIKKVINSIVPGVNGCLGEHMPDVEVENGHFKIRRTN